MVDSLAAAAAAVGWGAPPTAGAAAGPCTARPWAAWESFPAVAAAAEAPQKTLPAAGGRHIAAAAVGGLSEALDLQCHASCLIYTLALAHGLNPPGLWRHVHLASGYASREADLAVAAGPGSSLG